MNNQLVIGSSGMIVLLQRAFDCTKTRGAIIENEAYSGLGDRVVQQIIMHNAVTMSDRLMTIYGSSLDFKSGLLTHIPDVIYRFLLFHFPPHFLTFFGNRSPSFQWWCHWNSAVFVLPIISQIASESHRTYFRQPMRLFIPDVPSNWPSSPCEHW